MQEQGEAARDGAPGGQPGNGKDRVSGVGAWSEVSASRADLAPIRGLVSADIHRRNGKMPVATAYALGLIDDPAAAEAAILRQTQAREEVARKRRESLHARHVASGPAERARPTVEAQLGRPHVSELPENQDVDMQDVEDNTADVDGDRSMASSRHSAAHSDSEDESSVQSDRPPRRASMEISGEAKRVCSKNGGRAQENQSAPSTGRTDQGCAGDGGGADSSGGRGKSALGHTQRACTPLQHDLRLEVPGTSTTVRKVQVQLRRERSRQ